MLWHDKKRNVGRTPEAASGRYAWLISIARENPFTALWNAVLFVGGAILLLYHVKVAYLPDFSGTDLAGLLASVTLIGIVLLVFLAASFLLPSFVLSQFDKEWEKRHHGRMFTGRAEISLLLGLPVAAWGLAFAVPPLAEPWLPDRIATFSLVLITLLLLLPLLGMLFLACHNRKGRTASGRGQLAAYFWSNKVRLFALIAWTFLFFLPATFSVIFSSTTDPAYEWFLFGLILLMFIIINGAAYVSGREKWVEPFTIGTLMVGVVIPLLSNRPFLWPDIVVQSVGLGNRNAVEVVISYRQCQSFAKFGIACNYKENKDSEISLNNVNVLSRVGTSVLLELLVDTGAVKPGAADSGPGVLRTAEPGRYCTAAEWPNPPSHCSQCDDLTLRTAAPAIEGQRNRKLSNEYKSRLACVQMAIPKDQVTSISLSTTRRYVGFTSIIESGGHNP